MPSNIVWGTSLLDREHRLGHERRMRTSCGARRTRPVSTVLFNDLGVTDADFETLFPPDIAPVLDTTVPTVTSVVGGLLGGL